jgi:hypothetical protein
MRAIVAVAFLFAGAPITSPDLGPQPTFQDASPLRDMLTGRAANNAPAAANDQRGGDPQYNYHDHAGRLSHAQIMANTDSFVKMMKQAHLNGKLPPF